MACLKSESHFRQQQAPGVYAAKHARALQRAPIPPGPALCSAFTLLMACTKSLSGGSEDLHGPSVCRSRPARASNAQALPDLSLCSALTLHTLRARAAPATPRRDPCLTAGWRVRSWCFGMDQECVCFWALTRSGVMLPDMRRPHLPLTTKWPDPGLLPREQRASECPTGWNLGVVPMSSIAHV